MTTEYCREKPGGCGHPCAACPLASATTRGERDSPGAAALAAVDSRRGVVRKALLGAAGLGLVGLVAACDSTGRDDDPEVPEVVVSRDDVPPVGGDPYRSEEGHFYLVHNADGVLAFSWRCVHQGCEVPWDEDEERFHCPCHGSIYDRNGARLDGPARRPLDLVQIDVLDNGDVAVTTGEVTERSDYEPDQTVPYPANATD